MTNKGYTSVTLVSQAIGSISSGTTTLTTDQQTQATALIGFAEAYIDSRTHRSWLTPAITGEQYTVLTPELRLRQRPIASVESVQTRTTALGDTWLTLTSGTDYEILDAERGLLVFADGYANRQGRMLAQIAYSPNQPVPADITQAATAIVAASLYPALYPDRNGLTDVQADNQTKVSYGAGRFLLMIPNDAAAILNDWTLPVIG